MADCPHCGRPVAMVRPKCFYCGKPLPAELVQAASETAAQATLELERQLPNETAGAALPAADAPRRLLIILDLRTAEAATLARALELSAFEAGQRLRRGGRQLLRIAPEAEAKAEAERLRALGVAASLIDEAALPREPLLVSGGTLEPQRLLARSAEGRFEWKSDDLLLLVKGPIQRQYQAAETNVRHLKSAAPSEGYRFHLHRLSDPRPLELDPDAFEFHAERGQVGSSLLRLASWIDGFEPRARLDDAFRLLPPALGASDAGDETARALGRLPQKKGASQVLDNLRQFRFYSAWRAAVERSP